MLHLPCDLVKSHQLSILHLWYLSMLLNPVLASSYYRREGLYPHHSDLGNYSSKIHRNIQCISINVKKETKKSTNCCLVLKNENVLNF